MVSHPVAGVTLHSAQHPAAAAVSQPVTFQFAGRGWPLTASFTHRLATGKVEELIQALSVNYC